MTAWQQTFIYVGAPGLILAAFFLVIREPTRRPSASASTTGSGMRELYDFYRSHARTLTLHHLGFVSLILTGYAFVFWSVTFLVRIHGEEAARASTIFGWIFLVFGPLGPVFAAWIARRLSQRGRDDANMTAGMIGGILTVPAVLLLQFAPDAFWAYVLYAPAMLAVNSPFGIAAGALPVITPPQLRARVAAVYMLAGAIGMMFGPPSQVPSTTTSSPAPTGCATR